MVQLQQPLHPVPVPAVPLDDPGAALVVHDDPGQRPGDVPCRVVVRPRERVGVAVRALSEPGEGVIVQPPVYAPFFELIEGRPRGSG